MKISKIAKLCKDTKCVQYAVEEKGMWLGNGDCAYLIPEFAYLSQEGIALALGIGEKTRANIDFSTWICTLSIWKILTKRKRLATKSNL